MLLMIPVVSPDCIHFTNVSSMPCSVLRLHIPGKQDAEAGFMEITIMGREDRYYSSDPTNSSKKKSQ